MSELYSEYNRRRSKVDTRWSIKEEEPKSVLEAVEIADLKK